MSIVRVLVVAHLSLTAALLLAFVGVVLVQRLLASARPARRTTPLPARLSGALPAQAAVVGPASNPYPPEPNQGQPQQIPAQSAVRPREVSARGASVLDWTIDLRATVPSAGRTAAARTPLASSS